MALGRHGCFSPVFHLLCEVSSDYRWIKQKELYHLSFKTVLEVLVVMFYSAFGKILTLTLEAHLLYCLSGLCTTLLPCQGVFNDLIFKGKSVRFQQRMKALFANWSFFKSLNNSAMYIVANLFICMISSQGGGGG